MNRFYRFCLLLIFCCWFCTQATAQGLSASFNTAPNADCGSSLGCSSFTVNISGVDFEFSFVSSDLGRSMQWIPSRAGVSGGSMELFSGTFSDFNTNERLTVRRVDRQQFNFSSVFIQNDWAPVTVASFRQGVQVQSETLNQAPVTTSVNFTSALVDEVRISSNDFFGTVFDNFIACVPPVPGFTVNSPACLGTPSNFINASTALASVAAFAWDFTTDGTVDNTTKGNVSFTYPATGTYNARLTITQGRCTAFVNQQVVVGTGSTAPVVQGSLCPGATQLMGTSTEPDGTVITVTQGSSQVGTAQVQSGRWMVTIPAVTAGQVLNVRAAAPGKCESPAVTVTAGTDNTPPVIASCPANITVQTGPGATTCGQAVSWTAPTATDDCSSQINVQASHQPGDIFPVGNTTVTYTFTDVTGNSATCSFVVTVQDNTPPVFTCPANITVPQNGTGTIVTYPALTPTDNCSGNTTVQYSIVSGSAFPAGTTPVTVTVTDAAGNASTCQFNVTVVGTCTIVPPANITVAATAGQCGALVTYPAATTGSNCGTLTYSHASGAFFPVGVTTVTVTNTTSGETANFTITVADDVLPVLTNCPANITVQRAAGSTACTQTVNWTVPTATDNCGTPVLTASRQPGGAFPVGTTTVTYTATDASGNQVTCSFTVTVVDDNPPVVSNCPANISIAAAAGACSQVVSWTEPTATGSCNGPVTITRSHAPGSSFALGATRVTYTFTDAAGRSSTCAFDVVVTDGTGPVVSNCPANITVMAASGCSAPATWIEPTATDGCSLPVTVTRSHAPGSSFPAGATTVTYTFTDAAGNNSTCSFVVTVMDNAAPVISNCPANITVQTGAGNTACNQTATWTEPTATDGCGSAVTVQQTHRPGDRFPVGATTVTYTFTDAGGNSSTCSFVVTVQDNTLPVVSCPADITVTENGLNSGFALVNFPSATATDNCSGGVAIRYSHLSGSRFPVGITPVTVTATDAAENSGTCSFNVTVLPSCQLVAPANIVVDAEAGRCAAIVNYPAATTTGNCGTITYSHASGSLFPLGTTTVTARSASTEQSATFTITVVDKSAPVFANCPADITVQTGSASGACAQTAVWTAPTATDNCGLRSLTSSHQPGAVFPVGVTTVTYTATDEAGNQSQCRFTVTVVDNTAPVVSNCPANITVQATAIGGSCVQAVRWTEPTFSDNCGAPVTVTRSHAPGTVFPLGTTTVRYTFRDAAGNETLCTFTVTVSDKQAPVITIASVSPNVLDQSDKEMVTVKLNYNITDNCTVNAAATRIEITSNEPASTDDRGDKSPDWEQVDNTTIRLRAEAWSKGKGRVYTITIRTADGSGNQASKSVTVLAPERLRSGGYYRRNIPAENFQVRILPNPSSTNFTIVTTSTVQEALSFKVYDATGRLMESRAGIPSSGTTTLGQMYPGGFYYLEVQQGSQRTTLKLIKQTQ